MVYVSMYNRVNVEQADACSCFLCIMQMFYDKLSLCHFIFSSKATSSPYWGSTRTFQSKETKSFIFDYFPTMLEPNYNHEFMPESVNQMII